MPINDGILIGDNLPNNYFYDSNCLPLGWVARENDGRGDCFKLSIDDRMVDKGGPVQDLRHKICDHLDPKEVKEWTGLEDYIELKIVGRNYKGGITDGMVDEYISKMRTSGSWVSAVVIRAASSALK